MCTKRLTSHCEQILPLMQAYKKAIDEPPLSDEQFERLKKAIECEDIIFFVVYNEHIPIAMCSISRFYSTYKCNFGAIFEDFYIEKSYRGRGVSGQLISFVSEYCIEHQVDSIWVGASAGDLAMYQHLGFDTELGRLLCKSLERGE